MNSDKWGIGFFLPILYHSARTSTYDRERKWFRFISYLSALINESCSLHSMIARNKNALLVDWKGSFNNEKSQWFRDLALEKSTCLSILMKRCSWRSRAELQNFDEFAYNSATGMMSIMNFVFKDLIFLDQEFNENKHVENCCFLY